MFAFYASTTQYRQKKKIKGPKNMKALVLHYKLDENVSFGFSASEAPLYRVSQQVWNRLRNVLSEER